MRCVVLGLMIYSLTCCMPLFAVPAPVSSGLKTGFNAIDQSKLKMDVSYLASNALQGRLSLSPGDQSAIHWIVTQYKKIGLSPYQQHTFFQAVPLTIAAPDVSRNYLYIEHDHHSVQFKQPDFFMAYPKNVIISAPIVFVGYGITAPALHYDDYQHVSVKGKIVIAFEHEPQENNPQSIFNGTSNTIFAANMTKALNAQMHGAVALIIIPEPSRDHPSNQERRARINHKEVTTAQFIRGDALHIPVMIVSDRAANIFAPHAQLTNWQKEIDHSLLPQSHVLPHLGIKIVYQNKWVKEGESENVIGIIPGSNLQLKNEWILITAHHDHDGKEGNKIWHGADDNASGTVGVIEVANAMIKNIKADPRVPHQRSIAFIIFAAEEQGLLGSIYFTQHPLWPLNHIKAVINFDMIGRNEKESAQTKGLISIPNLTNNQLNLVGSPYSPEYLKMVTDENRFVGLTLDHRFDKEHALNVFSRSDHFPFALYGIPAIWWFTGFHPDYHQTTDTAEKINYSKMQKIIELAYLSAYAFSNTPPALKS